MKQNEMIHGFLVKESRYLEDTAATMHRMEHLQSGAQLIWLEREDENKTFCVSFKTVPWDDTGIFHILEHSVLSGSEHYPVKEPFVELLKSSMNTFLNAMTYADKTLYPVSSRNEQDFLNLVDVYMDAVLHPLSIHDPQAFLQEGWHYELEEVDGPLSINGVVYNEMKGAFSDPDTILQQELVRQLFPDTCYSCASGGHPEHIPELTYEAYQQAHRRFYHPSNAQFVLDGAMDIDAVLKKLDCFLGAYQREAVPAEISMQQPVFPDEKTCYYEAADEEDGVFLAWGIVYGSYDDVEKSMAVSLLSDVLCDSNESPLVRPILEQELAEDVEFVSMEGILQNYGLLVLRNVRPENIHQAWQTVEETMEALCENGLDHRQLNAMINRMEFAVRQKDYGIPTGLVNCMGVMESWLYDGDPALRLERSKYFCSLRQGVEQGRFEALLRELIHSPHQARVQMLPSLTLGEEKQRRETQRLAALQQSHTLEWRREIASVYHEFCRRQMLPDSEEQLSSLPKLSLSDIPAEAPLIPQQILTAEGVTVLHHPQETNGVLNLELYFDLGDLDAEELHFVQLLSELLGQTATERYDSLSLSSVLNETLGQFGADITVMDGAERTVPYLVVRISMLEEQKTAALPLIEEILQHSVFDQRRFLLHQIQQDRFGLEQGVISDGSHFALSRLAAGFTAVGALNEIIGGITHLRWLKELEDSFETQSEALSSKLSSLLRLLSKERLTLSVTGSLEEDWVVEVVNLFPEAAMGQRKIYQPAAQKNEGFFIPAEVGYAALAGRVNGHPSGSAYVAAQLLSLGHLWTEVRVKGGAYGTGMSVSPNGLIQFSSFRDPDPQGALDAFLSAAEALDAFCDSGEALDGYIISTLAALNPLLSSRAKGVLAAKRYFTGFTAEKQRQERYELLHTTLQDLRAFSCLLKQAVEQSGVCVIGGQSVVERCKEYPIVFSSITP